MAGMSRIAHLITLLTGIVLSANVSLAQAPEANRILIDYETPSNPASSGPSRYAEAEGRSRTHSVLLSHSACLGL